MRLITYNDDLVAIVSRRRVHFLPLVDELDQSAPLRRFIYLMAHYAHDVDVGELPGPYTTEAAELYARTVLIDDDELDARTGDTDEDLAEHFAVPLEQIALKRIDRREDAIAEPRRQRRSRRRTPCRPRPQAPAHRRRRR